jgi:hypothetical protein
MPDLGYASCIHDMHICRNVRPISGTAEREGSTHQTANLSHEYNTHHIQLIPIQTRILVTVAICSIVRRLVKARLPSVTCNRHI